MHCKTWRLYSRQHSASVGLDPKLPSPGYLRLRSDGGIIHNVSIDGGVCVGVEGEGEGRGLTGEGLRRGVLGLFFLDFLCFW